MKLTPGLLYTSIFLGTLSFLACGKNSAGRNQLSLVPDSEMNALGEDAYQDILNQSQRSRDSQLTQEVLSIGQRIAAASGESFDWQFALLNDSSANAFCLPGGKVAVYTGIIPIAENNAALAAVLGHEVAHATLRHASERMSQNLLLETGLSLLSLNYQNSEYKGLIAAALGIGVNFGIQLPFSRYHESEADRLGLKYMAMAGYDPKEAILLWQRMDAASGERLPEFISTHPDPKRRAADLETHMDSALALYSNAKRQTTFNLR